MLNKWGFTFRNTIDIGTIVCIDGVTESYIEIDIDSFQIFGESKDWFFCNLF
jgi:hypothetical protein